ncbi:MAG: hypothetical protein FWE22_03080 [Firmicutes bacterium]|nr:hypothetical protein [Bacillota bacterium]
MEDKLEDEIEQIAENTVTPVGGGTIVTLSGDEQISEDGVLAVSKTEEPTLVETEPNKIETSEETTKLSKTRRIVAYVGLVFVVIFTVFLIVFFTDFTRWNGGVGYIVLVSGLISIACFFMSKSWTKKLDHQLALDDLKEKDGVPLEDGEDIETEINKNAEEEVEKEKDEESDN